LHFYLRWQGVTGKRTL